MLARDRKRQRLNKRYGEKRDMLRNRVKDMSLSDEDRMQAVLDMQKLPRDSSKCRYRNRCAATGRSRGYYRKFGLSRMRLRELMLRGEVPGVVKASW
jgi:small subunit ribosomal protein S14